MKSLSRENQGTNCAPLGKWELIGIPMGTNCASLVADLFLFCYERIS